MGVGERGRVTIPKEMRERFGIGPGTEIEFRVVQGPIVMKQAARKLDLSKWQGRCKTGGGMDYDSTDRFIEDVRGR